MSPFDETHWTLISRLRSAGQTDADTRTALDELCRSYWSPIYAYLRRFGKSPEDAADLTQGFFLHLLSHDLFQSADRAKGRLRSLLLGALKNYMANQNRHDAAHKRGGDISFVHIDAPAGEQANSHPLLASPDASPELLYDRRWALCLLDRAIEKLRDEYAEKDKTSFFGAFLPLLTDSSPDNQAEIAANLHLTENALRIALHRFRKRYRELVHAEIKQTLDPGEDIDSEFAYLSQVVRSA